MRTQEQLEETEREADRQAQATRPDHLRQHNGEPNQAEQCPWCREELEKDIAKADARA